MGNEKGGRGEGREGGGGRKEGGGREGKIGGGEEGFCINYHVNTMILIALAAVSSIFTTFLQNFHSLLSINRFFLTRKQRVYSHVL